MSRPKTKLEEAVDNQVRRYLSDRAEVPTPTEVRQTYEMFYGASSGMAIYDDGNVPREESINLLVNEYLEQLPVRKNPGFAYVKEYKPWLRDAEEEIEWFYWNRYRNYLLEDKKWSRAAVRTIDKDTERILDYMADPRAPEPFERRGLVVASVQSGKTSNYIGLITRAADAGYKIIIVMAGVYNVLRNQTQARIEEGFVGRNIAAESDEFVGVGKYDKSRLPIVLTSRTDDFGKGRYGPSKAFGTQHTDAPFLFVVKKNNNSLKRVYEWLRDSTRTKKDDPLLLIDDEADNASINVRYKREKRDEEPSRINGQIRQIFELFDKKCYVGYTATPYANILIDPTVDTSDFGKDLFPSSFIYTLEDSTDYFGAARVFDDYDDPSPKYLRPIDDIDEILPPRHKSYARMARPPESLKEAIRAFLVATAIRGLRGDRNEHSSMMVNVSPYTEPQRSVKVAIEDYMEHLQDEIASYGRYEERRALRYSDGLSALHATWTSEYASSTEFSWQEVQQELCSTIRSVRVVCINTRTNDVLEYDLHTEHVIAIGGYRLSRGLTLEGLVVSYFSRNAKAYDALMQMARWFGYRFGYEDLCRVWMSDTSAGWYKFVADSTTSLVDDLRAMRQENKTPLDYGLKIRQSPDSLTVTARNKMGTGEKMRASIDLNRSFIETVAFDRRQESIDQNKASVSALLTHIARYASSMEEGLYQRVPADPVKEFLNSYINDDVYSPSTQRTPVLNYIDGRIAIGELEEWDVYVAHGEGHEVELAPGMTAKQEVRYPGSNTTAESLVVGEKHRLSSRGVEKKGLTQAQIAEADAAYKETHENDDTSDLYYRLERERPLLVIHPVLLRYTGKKRDELECQGKARPIPTEFWSSLDHEEEAYGWSISFPYFSQETEPVEYIFNQVAIDNMQREYTEESDDDYADDE